MTRRTRTRRVSGPQLPGVVGLVALVVGIGAFVLASCGPREVEREPESIERDAGTENGSCEDECQFKGARLCTGEGQVQQCDVGEDGCLVLVDYVQCPSYKRCESGTCVDEDSDCSNRCAPSADPRCDDEGRVIQCDDHDGDGCFEWGGAEACESGQVCVESTGSCEEADCEDACSEGETQCEGDLVKRCEQNELGCLEFTSSESCPEGEVCREGGCTEQTECQDECEGAICDSEEEIRRCSDVDGDGCDELESAESCGGDQVCQSGECVAGSSCRDECPEGDEICANGGVAECADHDGDGCVEFNEPQPCSGDQECVQPSPGEAECQTPDSSGKVVINEIFYDPLGSDVRGSGSSATSPTFIELGGPYAFDISNYTIELINGSNGNTYGSFDLPAGAELDSLGYAVVSMQNPNSYFTQTATSFTNVYQLMTPYQSGIDGIQNGPDNVVLKDDSGNVVDAVGYGNFGGGATFEGEGNPVPQTASGRSIGRDEMADSDDNAADFTSYFPTPGLKNSDLLINEVYPNQPGFDDKSKTFVEIAAPIPDWEDFVLDGYVLRGINGFNGNDYIPSSGAGIKLLGNKLHDGPTDAGYFVICNEEAAAPPTGPPCNVEYDGVDFQNGPDNFVLEYNGRRVDAVGYGTFRSSDTFDGEGDPAEYSQTDAGKSLSRWPLPNQFFDYDDNWLDFWKTQPTPGTTNEQP